jgi:hypothetical protein
MKSPFELAGQRFGRLLALYRVPNATKAGEARRKAVLT